MSIFREIEKDAVVELSPSQIALAQICMRKLAYYRARVKPEATPMNLVFGVCLHWVIEGFVRGLLNPSEMGAQFARKFDHLRMGKLIAMSKTKSSVVFSAIGVKLAEQFPAYFDNLGLVPVVIEGQFKINIGKGVILNLVIDFVGIATKEIYSPEGQLLAVPGDTVILDWKTAAMPEGELFARHGFQLTYYWLAVTLACEKLGIKPPKVCGYAAGLKPNIKSVQSESLLRATWLPVHWVERTESDIVEAVEYAHVVARRIRSGEFHRAPHMAYNSPCDSNNGRCDFAGACLEASLEGLSLTGRASGLTNADLV